MTIYLNQRAEKRSRIRGKIRYSRQKDGLFFDAILNDCGKKGLGMITEYPYLPNTSIYLSSGNPHDPAVQSAKITWSKPVSTSSRLHPRYRVGTCFV
jgi:hypothetical protein